MKKSAAQNIIDTGFGPSAGFTIDGKPQYVMEASKDTLALPTTKSKKVWMRNGSSKAVRATLLSKGETRVLFYGKEK